MAKNILPPIPQDEIKENPRWREWLRNLGNYIQQAQVGNAVWTILQGGTGASTAQGARANLGLGSMAVENSDNVTITGGLIDNVIINNSDLTDVNIQLPYGQFYSTVPQTAAVIDTVYTVDIDTQDGHREMTLATNEVTVTRAGVYNVMFSYQFSNVSTSQVAEVAVWPAVNGTDVPWSATSASIPVQHTGIPGYAAITANVLVSLNANDVVSMRWVTNNISASIFSNSTPPPFTAPLIPGVILTLQYVSSS